ncbi:MAG: class I SAM-dependent methyltransferase [Patescibacteria group bacterium]
MIKKQNPTKDYYNVNAEKWVEKKFHSFYHEKEFRLFRSKLKKGDRVLDIGCANGIHVPLFLGIGHELKYEGIDISNSFLKMAKSRYPQLSFVQTDLLDEKSFPRKKYDGFWAGAVLMHIPLDSWPQMLANIQNHMKSGAIGYISVPQERFANHESDTRHFEIFTVESFKKQIGINGWKVLQTGKKESTAATDWLWFLVQLP